MKKAINISIQKPCSEKFNNFSKTQLGGFCKSCSKEVIDFTKKSDKEILTYFTSKKENTCGHFLKNQLKPYYEPRNKKELKKHSLFSAFSFAFLSIFSSNAIIAQKNNTNTVVTEPIKKSAKKQLPINAIVKGVVYSSTDNFPLPGVSVVLKNSIIGTATDFDGVFALANIKEGDVLSFYYLGYKSQEITIEKKQNNLKIVLEEDSNYLDGLVTVGEVETNVTYKTKRSFWQRLKAIL